MKMKPSLFLLTLIGLLVPSHFPLAGETLFSSRSTDPVLCGVPPKSSALVSLSPEIAAETESLDLLLSALSPKQNQLLEEMINRGSLEDLVQIDGIAEGRAKVIIQARPFKEVKELMLIKGFGYNTVASIIMFFTKKL